MGSVIKGSFPGLGGWFKYLLCTNLVLEAKLIWPCTKKTHHYGLPNQLIRTHFTLITKESCWIIRNKSFGAEAPILA